MGDGADEALDHVIDEMCAEDDWPYGYEDGDDGGFAAEEFDGGERAFTSHKESARLPSAGPKRRTKSKPRSESRRVSMNPNSTGKQGR